MAEQKLLKLTFKRASKAHKFIYAVSSECRKKAKSIVLPTEYNLTAV